MMMNANRPSRASQGESESPAQTEEITTDEESLGPPDLTIVLKSHVEPDFLTIGMKYRGEPEVITIESRSPAQTEEITSDEESLGEPDLTIESGSPAQTEEITTDEEDQVESDVLTIESGSPAQTEEITTGDFAVDEERNRGGWHNPPLTAQYMTYNAGIQGHGGDFVVDEQRNRGGWPNPPLTAQWMTYNAGVQGHGDDERNRGGWPNPPLTAQCMTYNAAAQGHADPVDDWHCGKGEKYPYEDWNNRKKYAPDNRKFQENWQSKPSDRNQYNPSRFRVSPRRTRGIGYRNESHRRYQSYHSDDKYKKSDFKQSNSRKKYSHKAHSRSSSTSECDGMENQFALRTYNLWQNDKSKEDQTKQLRVEEWVKSVNKSNMWCEKPLPSDEKDTNYSNQFSSEKQESSRKSVTKFDRIKISSRKYKISRSEVNKKNSDVVDQRNVEEADADGLWGDVEQSNIKWNLSDEEIICLEPKKESKEKNKHASSDKTWNNVIQKAKRSRCNEDLLDDCKMITGDGWSDVDQSDIKRKNDGTNSQKDEDQNLEPVNKSYAIQEVVKCDSENDWKECGDKIIAKELSFNKDESWEMVAQLKSDTDVIPDGNDADCGPGSSACTTNIQLQESFNEVQIIPVSLTDEKHSEVSAHEPMCSDDGRWFTVSDEGEVE